MQSQLEPYSTQQLYSKVKAIKQMVEQEGSVEMVVNFRSPGQQTWTETQGKVELSADGKSLTWRDNSGNSYFNWPPNNVELAGFSRLAEEAANHIEQVAYNANMNTAFITRGAATIIANQSARLEREQSTLDGERRDVALAYANIRAAQDDLRMREQELDRERREMDEECVKIANSLVDKDVQRCQELEEEKKKLEEEKASVAREKEQFRLLRESLREGVKQDITHHVSPQSCRSRIPSVLTVSDDETDIPPSAPSTTTTTSCQPPRRQQRTSIQQWSSSTQLPPKRRIKIDVPDFPTRSAPQRKTKMPMSGPLSPTDFDDEDSSDEESNTSPTNFSNVSGRSLRGQVMVGTETFALNPDEWYQVTADNIERLLTFLKDYANVKHNHWSEHVVQDVIVALRGLLTMVIEDPDLVSANGYQTLARTLLKRIIMSRVASQGASTNVVNAFSAAVDGGTRPEWIKGALRQAYKDVKDEPSTRQKAKPGKKGKDSK